MRVGIVGYGLAGRVFHGRLLAAVPEATVAAVVTRDPGRRAEAVADHPGVTCYDSTEAMLAAGAVDLAVVASPTAAHAAAALACVAARVPVVVDKPLAPDAEQARLMVRRAAAEKVPLTVFQNRRWDADQLTLRRLVAEGALGTVHRYESRFERWRPDLTPGKWRERRDQGGGTLLDLGSHLVDQALVLFGPVRSVYAEVDARRGGADDDVFLALHHEDGTYSHLWCGAVTAAPGPRLRVLGGKAAYLVDGLDGQEDALRAGRPSTEATAPPGRLVRGGDSEPVPTGPGRWDLFYPAVVAALHDGAPMPVDPADAVTVLDILEAARRSATGRRVVTL